MKDVVLSCEGVTKSFGEAMAVRGADLEMERGQTYALLGPSGCGKTTLLRLIAGFDRADAGRIVLDGKVLTDDGTFVAPEKRRVGMVFQDYALFNHLTVAANIAFGVGRGVDKKERTDQLLAIVGLEGLGSRMPFELSGGQQQRVALARCVAARPEVVLLDEPFSNLDPGMRGRVRSEIKQIIESLGIAALFVTHDQEEALSIAGRVAVMLEGRIEQVGEPAEIYTHPATRRVAEFLGETNFFAGDVLSGRLEFELGTMPVATDLSGPVSVMVRPEALALSFDSGVLVDVERCEYFGHDQLIHVRLPSGTPAKIRTLTANGVLPGQRVGLELRGDVVLYGGSS